jgi:hypothetical protein
MCPRMYIYNVSSVNRTGSPSYTHAHTHTLTHTRNHTHTHTHTHTHSLEKMESKRHPHGQPLADLFFGSWQQVLTLLAFSLLSSLSLLAAVGRLVLWFWQQVLSLLAFSLLSLLSLLAAVGRLVLWFVAAGTQFT